MTTVIVTGAAGGLGAATVRQLVGRGTQVLAVDVDADALERTLAGLDGPGEAVSHPADVTDEPAVAAFVRTAVERFGRLDALFANAAIEGPIAEVQDIGLEDYERVMRVNVRSVFLGLKHAIPVLRAAGGGSVLNTASTGGMMGWPGICPYVASKHAVVGLTRAVALENARHGVRVNVLCPGPMDTRMIWSIGEAMAPGDRPEQRRQLEATIPVGRLGRPEEVAAFASWLLLDAPGYLTGAVLPIDGAQTAG
jgi:NAD(P)-dependent dehydrogenase (short-subunit alcohol dehydrogenase family)